jgi:hypothetical protein
VAALQHSGPGTGSPPSSVRAVDGILDDFGSLNKTEEIYKGRPVACLSFFHLKSIFLDPHLAWNLLHAHTFSAFDTYLSYNPAHMYGPSLSFLRHILSIPFIYLNIFKGPRGKREIPLGMTQLYRNEALDIIIQVPSLIPCLQ